MGVMGRKISQWDCALPMPPRAGFPADRTSAVPPTFAGCCVCSHRPVCKRPRATTRCRIQICIGIKRARHRGVVIRGRVIETGRSGHKARPVGLGEIRPAGRPPCLARFSLGQGAHHDSRCHRLGFHQLEHADIFAHLDFRGLARQVNREHIHALLPFVHSHDVTYRCLRARTRF